MAHHLELAELSSNITLLYFYGVKGQLWEVGVLSYNFSKFRKTESPVFSA